MVALNHVLGSGMSSRLMQNLREKHGYTYGISSALDLRAGAGAYQVSSDVRTNATDSALVEAIGEYRRIVAEPVPAPELQAAVNNLVSSFPSSVQSVQALTNRIQSLIIWGLPVDFYASYRERLAALRGRVGTLPTAVTLTMVVVVAAMSPRSKRRSGRGIRDVEDG